MILSVFRNFTRSQLAARTADPETFIATHKMIATISQNPRGHVLGIVGYGNISKHLAAKARLALGMKIHYFDIVRADLEEEQVLEATYHESLDDLLKIADCVTLHMPLNEHTRDLIDAKALSLKKPGSRIINTARGPKPQWRRFSPCAGDRAYLCCCAGCALSCAASVTQIGKHGQCNSDYAYRRWASGHSSQL